MLAKGPVIEDVLLSPTHTTPASLYPQSALPKSFSENERDYIISVLKQCKGKIWGIDGAAELLKVPPSTLKSKMKKLGIRKESY